MTVLDLIDRLAAALPRGVTVSINNYSHVSWGPRAEIECESSDAATMTVLDLIDRLAAALPRGVTVSINNRRLEWEVTDA